jgi:hypothetical protein
MKKIILVIAFLSFTFGFAQNKNTTDAKTVKAYTEAFNTQNFEAIYNLYSDNSKKATSLNRIKSYNERLFNTTGKINVVKFLGKDVNSYQMYQLSLNKTNTDALNLYIKLNAKHEIEDISFNKK